MKSKYRVIIPSNVKNEISEIVTCFISDRYEYAQKIFDKIFERINTLKYFPEKGRIVPELQNQNIYEYREIIESYWRIIYKIFEKEVIIYVVIDGRRNVEDILIEKLKNYIF